MTNDERKLFQYAFYLSIFTIAYNLIEGVISMVLGYSDETLTLFGFGVDSFIEVISGIGILIMVLRIWKHTGKSITPYEITALRITGIGFYLLSAGLTAGIVVNLIYGHKPESTIWGVVIAIISIISMIWLVWAKKRIGRKLNSDPIIADANCTLVCLYMSIVLLVSSLIYELTGFSYIDSIGAAGLVWFSVKEGMEAMGKAKKRSYAECSCGTGEGH
ncbi:MAG: cation transporter [Bacteroidia bacterium]|nr:cation transporter [Bacteroidia bacterium]